MNKRDFIKTGLIGVTGFIFAPKILKASTQKKDLRFTTANLTHHFNYLGEFMPSASLYNHYNYHYINSITKLNDSIRHSTSLKEADARTIFRNANAYNSNTLNYAGAFFNHRIFWKSLTANSSILSGELEYEINKNFGSLKNLKNDFIKKSFNINKGWAWLIYKSGELKVVTTSNNDNPMMSNQEKHIQGFPLIAIDLWEHAYKDNFNKKDEYISSYLNFIDWNFISWRYDRAKNI